MSLLPDILYLSASASLKRFDRPLLRLLSRRFVVGQWEYSQTLDEASSPETAIVLLHDYLKHHDRPIHLVGHGLGGVIGLLYARRHPERVRSLSLLAVAAQPAATWHTHYYVQRQLLPCSRQQLLAQTSRSLFGRCLPYPVQTLVAALEADLDQAPTPHSLFHLSSLPQGGVAMPMLVCGSRTDAIVSPTMLRGWQPWLKSGDRLWECDRGHHFFHFFYPELVAEQVLSLVDRDRQLCASSVP